MTINAVKCRDAVIFSPHPLSRKTALEITRVLRTALKEQGARERSGAMPRDAEHSARAGAHGDLRSDDRDRRRRNVKASYGSGKPAYGVGAGNATVVIDETADVADAAKNTRISKTQNHGSGCSCDGNLLAEASVYDRFLDALQKAATSRAPRRSGGSRR